MLRYGALRFASVGRYVILLIHMLLRRYRRCRQRCLFSPLLFAMPIRCHATSATLSDIDATDVDATLPPPAAPLP